MILMLPPSYTTTRQPTIYEQLKNKRTDIYVNGALPGPELILPRAVLLPDELEQEEVKDEDEESD